MGDLVVELYDIRVGNLAGRGQDLDFVVVWKSWLCVASGA